MTTPIPAAAHAAASTRPAGRALPRVRGRAANLVAPMTWDPIRISLAVLMLVSISRIHQQIPQLAIFRPGITLTALSLALAIGNPRSVRMADLFASWPVRRAFWFFGLTCVGALFGLSIGSSRTFMMEHFIPNFVFFALIVVSVRGVGDLRMLIGGYTVALGILVFLSLFVWESRSFDNFERMYSPNMYDANDLGAVFAAGIPLALWFAQTSGAWGRTLGYLVAIGSPASIALTGSRGGFLALVATGLGLLVMMPNATWTRRIAGVVFAIVAMAIVAPEGYLTKMNSILNPTEDYNIQSETGRVAIWGRGLLVLRDRPLTGVGVGNFVRAQWEHPTLSATGTQIRPMSAHNTFLQALVDNGIPAFLVFVSIVGGGIFGMARIRRRLPKAWMRTSAESRMLYMGASYLPAAFFGWAVAAFFVSHAYLPPFYVLAALLGSTLLLMKRLTAMPRGAHAGRPATSRIAP